MACPVCKGKGTTIGRGYVVHTCYECDGGGLALSAEEKAEQKRKAAERKVSAMSRPSDAAAKQCIDLLNTDYSTVNDEEKSAALALLGPWNDLRAIEPIFVGCVANAQSGNGQKIMQAMALKSLDQLNRWITSTKPPALEVSCRKLNAFRAAAEKKQLHMDPVFVELGRRGTEQDADWILVEYEKKKSGSALSYMEGLLLSHASKITRELLDKFTSLGGFEEHYWEDEPAYQWRVFEISTSKIQELAKDELHRRGS